MDDLIEKNMGLVVSVVNSFKPQNPTEREDYIQAGRIGLWKALKKYDPSKGAVLSTYAWNPIRWEIIKEIKSAKKGRYTTLTRARCPIYKRRDELWEFLPSILSEEEVNFLELRKMGYKLAEMADITGKTSSYVKRIFYRAVKRIREKNE
jgi:DNA-directed RNA polymerase specialized sigma subunit